MPQFTRRKTRRIPRNRWTPKTSTGLPRQSRSVYCNPQANDSITTIPAYGADVIGHVLAYQRGTAAGVTHHQEIFKWSDIEPTVGNYNWTAVDLFWNNTGGLPVAMGIVAKDVDATAEYVPLELQGVPLSDASVYGTYTNLITAFKARYADYQRLRLLNVANEPDNWLRASNTSTRVTQLATFAAFTKAFAQSIIGQSLDVTVSFSFSAAAEWVTNGYDTIKSNVTYISYNYYPTDASYVVKDIATLVGPDFAAMQSCAGVGNRWGMWETGAPSSATLSASESYQATYMSVLTTILLPAYPTIRNCCVAWMFDLNTSIVTSSPPNGYGLTGNAAAFFSSLGNRKVDGTTKASWSYIMTWLGGVEMPMVYRLIPVSNSIAISATSAATKLNRAIAAATLNVPVAASAMSPKASRRVTALSVSVPVSATAATLTGVTTRTLVAATLNVPVTATAMSPKVNRRVTATSVTIPAAASSASTFFHRRMTASAAASAVVTSSVNAWLNRRLAANTVTTAIAASSTNTQFHRRLAANAVANPLAPTVAALKRAFAVSAASVGVSLSAQASSFRINRVVSALSVSVPVSAQAVTFRVNRVLAATSTGVPIASIAATLQSASRVILASPASVALASSAATLRANRILSALATTTPIATTSVLLGPIRRITAAGVSIPVASTAAFFRRGYGIAAAPTTTSIATSPVNFLSNRRIVASGTTMPIVVSQSGLFLTRRIVGGSFSVPITPLDASLILQLAATVYTLSADGSSVGLAASALSLRINRVLVATRTATAIFARMADLQRLGVLYPAGPNSTSIVTWQNEDAKPDSQQFISIPEGADFVSVVR